MVQFQPLLTAVEQLQAHCESIVEAQLRRQKLTARGLERWIAEQLDAHRKCQAGNQSDLGLITPPPKTNLKEHFDFSSSPTSRPLRINLYDLLQKDLQEHPRVKHRGHDNANVNCTSPGAKRVDTKSFDDEAVKKESPPKKARTQDVSTPPQREKPKPQDLHSSFADCAVASVASPCRSQQASRLAQAKVAVAENQAPNTAARTSLQRSVFPSTLSSIGVPAAAPAIFAQPSNVEPTEELFVLPLPVASLDGLPSVWQSSALFAPAPPSPPPLKNPPAPGVAAANRRPPATGQQGDASSGGAGKAISLSTEAKHLETAQRGAATTTPVRERIMLFETKGSTPVVRHGAGISHPSGYPSASRHAGSLPRANGTGSAGGPSSALQASRLVDGCSLFTPVQKQPKPSGEDMKPKELFKGQSDMAPPAQLAGNKTTANVSTVASVPSLSNSLSQASVRGYDNDRLDSSRLAHSDAFDRLAAGGKRDDLIKPKSLKAAEQAKLQEEKKQRERQERELERERVRAAAVVTAGGATGMSSSSSFKDVNAAAKPVAKKALRRSAVLCPPPEAPPFATSLFESSLVPSSMSSSSSAAPLATGSQAVSHTKGLRPPVPAFKDPFQVLRQIDLPPKNPEDNYEISECSGDSDHDDQGEKERLRSLKHKPKWSETYLEALERQTNLDPDSIFGTRVPICNMDDIFKDDLYKQVGKHRPKRQRGSSGDWRKDRLTRTEIRDYKSRMGQLKGWDEFRGTR